MEAEDGQTQTKILNLEQVSFATSSNFKDFDNEDTKSLIALPNPMQTTTNIQFASAIKEIMFLRLYSLTGRLIYERPVNVTKGTNVVTLSRNNLSTGIYFISIEGEEMSYKTTKLIVK